MPVSFQFVTEDGPVTLDEVDKYICDITGVPVDDKRFSFHYQILSDVYLGMLMAYGGSYVTCDMVSKTLDKIPEATEEEWILLCSVIEKYDFHAWR